MNQDKCPGSLRLFFQVHIEDYIGVKHNPLATCPQVMIQSWFRLVWKLLEACVYIHIYIYIIYIYYIYIIYILYIYNQRSSDSIFSPFLLFCSFWGSCNFDFRHPKKRQLNFSKSKFSFGRVDSGNGLGSDRFQHREDLSVSWDAGDEILGW